MVVPWVESPRSSHPFGIPPVRSNPVSTRSDPFHPMTARCVDSGCSELQGFSLGPAAG
jgi:hypothetical protein